MEGIEASPKIPKVEVERLHTKPFLQNTGCQDDHDKQECQKDNILQGSFSR